MNNNKYVFKFEKFQLADPTELIKKHKKRKT